MKKVEMSAAGLAILLERAECFLRLHDVLMRPEATRTQMAKDLEEASREARHRLGLPARVPHVPDGTGRLVGNEVGASVAVTLLDQQEDRDTIFAKGKQQVTSLPAELTYGYKKPNPQDSDIVLGSKAILKTPVSDAVAEKSRECKELVLAAMAIEDRYPDGPLPPAAEEEVKALLVRADTLEGEIDLLDSRHSILNRPTHCVFPDSRLVWSEAVGRWVKASALPKHEGC